jgi:DNA-binding IscR family transcriptional regulator
MVYIPHYSSGRCPLSNPSLKGLIPVLAKAVGMTPAALYERQRALVRAGLLHAESGRGPGSGVRATPESVSMLLVALLATGSLSETESQTKAVANLKSAMKRCPLTGKKTFATALTAALASQEMAKRVRWLEVERGGGLGSKVGARIFYRPSGSELLVSLTIDLLSERDTPVASQFGFEELARRKSALDVRSSLILPWGELARALKEAQG